MTAAPRRFAVRSYGCQMNAYDSERMAEALLADGLEAVPEADAELLVLNTCHIREKAAEKLYSDVGRIVAAARRGGRERPMIAVAGCTAQAEGAEIAARAPAVDVIVGPQAYHRLPVLVRSRAGTGSLALDIDMPADSKFAALPGRRRVSPSAFLTVQEGCDKFCAFCVVPYTRGAEASRPLADIVREAEALLAGGAREITLLGQNVNAWCDPTNRKADFGVLLETVAGLAGIERLRYTTSHPRDVGEAMIAAHRDLPVLMPYLHLPVQSGSDRVLAAMNRRHDRRFYLELVDRFRAARPDLALSSDFIVGFPGETDADFRETLDLVAEVRFAGAFSFKYSPRLGTPAADRPDQVAEEEKTERLARLQALILAQQQAFNQSCVGRTCAVLIDRPGRRPGQWIGKSPWLQSVVVEGNDLGPGMMIEVVLIAAGPNSLTGRRTGMATAAW
jgi:tRNA-2-methylthio-N6-dimethylallyladenosine synthase